MASKRNWTCSSKVLSALHNGVVVNCLRTAPRSAMRTNFLKVRRLALKSVYSEKVAGSL